MARTLSLRRGVKFFEGTWPLSSAVSRKTSSTSSDERSKILRKSRFDIGEPPALHPRFGEESQPRAAAVLRATCHRKNASEQTPIAGPASEGRKIQPLFALPGKVFPHLPVFANNRNCVLAG